MEDYLDGKRPPLMERILVAFKCSFTEKRNASFMGGLRECYEYTTISRSCSSYWTARVRSALDCLTVSFCCRG